MRRLGKPLLHSLGRAFPSLPCRTYAAEHEKVRLVDLNTAIPNKGNKQEDSLYWDDGLHFTPGISHP